jgi:mRNA interferase MazF
MRRGDIYLVKKLSSADPKRQRAFVVVSRQVLIDSDYATVICAPVYTKDSGLSTQVDVGAGEGLKHDSAVHCDGLVSLPKAALTNYIGRVDFAKQQALDVALGVALAIEDWLPADFSH